jgi:lysozyme
MRTSQNGVDLIKHFEGVRLDAYQCSAGVWTIGYGHTRGVKPGARITEHDAERMLESDIESFERGVLRHVKVTLTQSQFDALVSFSFNVGLGALVHSALLRRLNAGDIIGAADQFLRWNKAAGKVLAGLVRRRAAERALFLGQDWRVAAGAG